MVVAVPVAIAAVKFACTMAITGAGISNAS